MSGLVVFNQWVAVAGCQSGGPTGMLTPISEAVAVLGVNQLSPLSQTPDPASPISLIVNGAHTFTAADPAPAFIVSGTAIAWVSPIYSVTPSDTVVALYYAYLE